MRLVPTVAATLVLAAAARPALAKGEDYCPLASGDNWSYRSSGVSPSPYTGAVFTDADPLRWQPSPGFQYHGLIFGETHYVRFAQSSLQLWSYSSNTGVPVLFFDRPVGSTWTFTTDGWRMQNVKVTYRGQDAVRTPAGTFRDCLRFDLAPPGGTGPRRIWFARNVGVVRYEEQLPAGVRLTELASGCAGGRAIPSRALALPTRKDLVVGDGRETWPATPLAVADVNGDGKLDVVTADAIDSTATVLAGDGRGGFAAPVAFPAAQGPRSLAVADMDGDGRQDVVVACSGNGGNGGVVTVLLQDGRGGFTRKDYPTKYDPRAIAVGDLDGDGRPDVVTTNRPEKTVSVLLNDGHGALKARIDRVLAIEPEYVALKDVDHDGKADLFVVGDRDAPGPATGPLAGMTKVDEAVLSVLPGDGRGGFGLAVDHVAGYWASGLVVTDVDRDGSPDVVVGLHGHGPLAGFAVFKGDGTGRFSLARSVVTGAGDADGVAVGDVDGDRRPDVVTVLTNGYAQAVISTQASRLGFAPAVRTGVGGQPVGVVIADLDGDGKGDVVTVGYGKQLTVRLSR